MKAMVGIISVYKSDAVNYCKENNIKREDVVIMCAMSDIDGRKEKFDELVIISYPMGVPQDEKYLRDKLLTKVAEAPVEKPKPKAKAPTKKPAAKKVTPKPKTDDKKG